jgi:hypothetical protein
VAGDEGFASASVYKNWGGGMKQLLLLLVLCVSNAASAASTSSWIKLGGDSNVEATQGKLGASYVSINFVAASVYQNSDWWTNIVETNRSALATASVAGLFSGGKTLSDRRVSPPMEMKKNKSNLDFGWSQSLVHDLPVDFQSLSIDVGIAKTSEDGLSSLISAANDLSKTVPTLSVPTATTATVSAVKLLADFIFDKKLVEEKLHSSQPLTAPAGGALEPGFYAVLGGTTKEEYLKYLGKSASGPGLVWNGYVLKYDNEPVLGVTFFIVQVAYKDNLYDPVTLPDAALTSDRNWAKLYRNAITQVNQLADLSKFNESLRNIAQIKADAEQLLNDDPAFVQTERVLIQQKVAERINKIKDARWDYLKKIKKDGPGPVSVEPEEI